MKLVCLKIIDSIVIKWLKVIFILLTGVGLAISPPNVQLSESEKLFETLCFALSFAFFTFDTIANMIRYGVFQGKDTYFKRDYLNILNFLLLIIELLWFTPLS